MMSLPLPDLCLQRRRNLMIFLAAWSCFLVRNDPLLDKAGTAQTTSRYSEGPGAAGLG